MGRTQSSGRDSRCWSSLQRVREHPSSWERSSVGQRASFSLRKVFSGPQDILKLEEGLGQSKSTHQLGEDLQRTRGHPSTWGGSAVALRGGMGFQKNSPWMAHHGTSSNTF